MPKVSVLTPIYNTNHDYLKEMIESILNQTFTDFEFIILNDSPQNQELKNIVISYQDPRIIYLENKTNLGISGSRNRLLKEAKGEYIAIFDHDDVSMPERLQKEVDVLDNNPNIGVVSSNSVEYYSKKITNYPIKNNAIKSSLINRGCVVCHPASMIRRSVLLDNNIYWEDEYSPCEDSMLWAKLIGKTMFYNIKEPLLRYRDHLSNTSHIKHEEMSDKGALIKNFMHKEYPNYANQNTTYFLFGFIPFLRIKKYGNKIKFLLFGFIPFILGKRF